MVLKALLLVAVMLSRATNACSPTDDPSDASMDTVETHLERLCLSDLVFKGRITNTVTTEDADVIYVTTTFRVLEYFRDTTEINALNSDVNVDFPKDFLCCTTEPFDTSESTFLVFAFATGGGNGFSIPCVGHPAFDSVPSAFFDAVANDNPCGDGGFIGGPVEQPDGTPPTVAATTEESTTTTAAADMGLPILTISSFVSDEQCPKDGVDGVSVEAQVDLTGVDPTSISYIADFDFSNETCRVDLTSCPGTPVDLCYCVQQSGSVYTIRLDMTSDLRYSDTEFKVTIPDSSLTSVVATSNSSNYPEILAEIIQSLRTDKQVFRLDATFHLLDISEESDTANLWYEVTGLNLPYQIMIQPIPGGQTFVSNNGPLIVVAVDLNLNYTGLTLSYQELDGLCARNNSQTYTFSAADVTKASLITLTSIFLGFGVLICALP